jgi:uncharacterized membrane protein
MEGAMTDTQAAAMQPAATQSQDELQNLRTITIIVYALYLAALCNGVTAIIGLVLAYVKRKEASGTIYESHLTNTIEIFWVGLVLGLACIPLFFLFGLGVLIAVGLAVWLIYRVVRGLVHAIESKAY